VRPVSNCAARQHLSLNKIIKTGPECINGLPVLPWAGIHDVGMAEEKRPEASASWAWGMAGALLLRRRVKDEQHRDGRRTCIARLVVLVHNTYSLLGPNGVLRVSNLCDALHDVTRGQKR
jgi:hypothetical protein